MAPERPQIKKKNLAPLLEAAPSLALSLALFPSAIAPET
ncbi:MAG: hypothetical protein QOG54_2121 [Actinomycetota bacterium]|nr:hypothetical protein [Actinomycetota bacterium]